MRIDARSSSYEISSKSSGQESAATRCSSGTEPRTRLAEVA